jgi:hypothetical protein
VAHFVLNAATGGPDAAAARLRERTWGIGADEPHRDALSPGDLLLIHAAGPGGGFIARAVVRAVVGAPATGVELCDVELWDRAVPMQTVAERVDPDASNPLVQENARSGFRAGVVRITPGEYEAALAACRAYQAV